MRVSIVLAVAASLSACGVSEPDGETVGYENHALRIVDVNRPKHFNVDVVDERGNRYNRVARSKHCANWRSMAVVGREYQIPFRLVRGTDGVTRSVMMERVLNDILCVRR